MSSSHELKKGVSVYLIANIINASIPFILLPVMTRILSPEEYGEIAIFVTIIGAFSALVGVTFVGSVNRKFFDEIKLVDYGIFITSCIQLIILATTITIILVFLFLDKISQFVLLDSKWVLVAVLVAFFNVIVTLRLGQWQVKRKPLSYAFFQFFISSINALLSIVAVVYLSLGAEGRMGGIFMASFFGAVISIILISRQRGLRFFVFNKSYIKEIVLFGVPLVPHVAGGFLINSIDRVVIAAEIDLKAAGIYMAAIQLVLVASIIFDSVNKAFSPWLFDNLNNKSLRLNSKIVLGTYLWFLVIWLGVFISFKLAPFLASFILGADFREAAFLIGWLAVGQAFKGMYLMVTNYCFYAKKTGCLSIISIVTGVLNVFLLIYFIRIAGVIGAAYAYSCSMALRFLAVWWLANRCHPMPWFTFFNANEILGSR